MHVTISELEMHMNGIKRKFASVAASRMQNLHVPTALQHKAACVLQWH